MDYHVEVWHPQEDHKDNTAVLCRFQCAVEDQGEREVNGSILRPV